MAETSITIERADEGHNEASAKMLIVAQAAQRATDQVADVLLQVKREYPEWNLPFEIALSEPA